MATATKPVPSGSSTGCSRAKSEGVVGACRGRGGLLVANSRWALVRQCVISQHVLTTGMARDNGVNEQCPGEYLESLEAQQKVCPRHYSCLHLVV